MSTNVTLDTTIPLVSVVIPVRNDPVHLRQCLGALALSTHERYEVIVVDDGSTDDTAQVAAECGARVIAMPDCSGPALARNRGAREASGDIVLFNDADVCVAPYTLQLFVATFENEPDAVAVFGSYDDRPDALNLVSLYKNLLHHFTHQNGNRNASTFWSGCGAVRRDLFLELGGFDVGYGRPCIEDIELGARMTAAGHRIILNRDIQVQHLKHWTLWGMVKTDVFDRAIPWTQLILREQSTPNDLNLKMSQRFSALLCCGLLGAWIVGLILEPILILLPITMLVATLIADRLTSGRRGQLAMTLPLIVVACWMAAIWKLFGFWLLLPILLIAGVVMLNFKLFRFFTLASTPLFALAALPLHWLYFVYSSATFAICTLHHKLTSRRWGTAPE